MFNNTVLFVGGCFIRSVWRYSWMQYIGSDSEPKKDNTFTIPLPSLHILCLNKSRIFTKIKLKEMAIIKLGTQQFDVGTSKYKSL